MDLSNYLTDLGFKASDRPSVKDVKAKWKDACRTAHPDAGGSEEEFLKVTHAYKMLTDAEYRQKDFLKNKGKGQGNARGDLNIRIMVAVTFEDAFFGREIKVSFNTQEFDVDAKPVIKEHQDVVTVDVDLPEGSIDGHQFISKGNGHKMCGVSGDAHINFNALPHQRFRVQGHDVVAVEKVPLETMLKGGKLEILTMYGDRDIKIRPGSKPGDKVTIPVCGVAKLGNHVVVLDPVYPTRDELKEGSWKSLGIDWSEDLVKDEEEVKFTDYFFKLRS